MTWYLYQLEFQYIQVYTVATRKNHVEVLNDGGTLFQCNLNLDS